MIKVKNCDRNYASWFTDSFSSLMKLSRRFTIENKRQSESFDHNFWLVYDVEFHSSMISKQSHINASWFFLLHPPCISYRPLKLKNIFSEESQFVPITNGSWQLINHFSLPFCLIIKVLCHDGALLSLWWVLKRGFVWPEGMILLKALSDETLTK